MHALSITPVCLLVQLLSDRRPAAQALLRELILAPGDALRTDDASQQILQVWLNAAEQAANAEIATAETAEGEEEVVPAPTKMGTGEAAVGLTSLLLDSKHVSLRRTLLNVNPAATVSSMTPQMKSQLVKLLSEALSGSEGLQVAVNLLDRSASARSQRKRLKIMFQASVPKVLNSSPASVWQLATFTAAVVFGVFVAHIKRVFHAAANWLRSLFVGSNRQMPNPQF
jgi:hypothetical protein